MLIWLRNWWRGYSDRDVASLKEKLAGPKVPGGVILLTRGEYNAMRRSAHLPLARDGVLC